MIDDVSGTLDFTPPKRDMIGLATRVFASASVNEEIDFLRDLKFFEKNKLKSYSSWLH